MPLFACQNEIPSLVTCPPAGSKVLLFDVTGSVQYKGMALMGIDLFKCCIISQMFGAGTITIKGIDLVAGIYYNSQFVQNLMVFAWNIPNYLIREGQNGLDTDLGQWRYVRNGDNLVVGIEIYGIGYGDDDLFTIVPIASCTGLPVATPSGGVQFERVTFSGDGATTEFRIAHGLGGVPSYVIQPVGDDSAGEYSSEADATYIIITYNVAPVSGASNVIFDWAANL